MPNSRRRKQRVAESQRQLERARRKIKQTEQKIESEAAPAPPNRLDKYDKSGDHNGEITIRQRVSPGPSTSAETIEKEESKGGGWFGSWASVYTGLVNVSENEA